MDIFKNMKIENRCFADILKHSFKHPQQNVCGFILGTKDNSKLICSHYFPLFHTHLLTPMIKVAYDIAENICKQQDSMSVLGFYVTGSETDSNKFSDQQKFIFSKIKLLYPNIFFCMIDFKNPNSDDSQLLKIYPEVDSKLVKEDFIIEKSLLTEAYKFLLTNDFFDFDDHLTNPNSIPLKI